MHSLNSGCIASGCGTAIPREYPYLRVKTGSSRPSTRGRRGRYSPDWSLSLWDKPLCLRVWACGYTMEILCGKRSQSPYNASTRRFRVCRSHGRGNRAATRPSQKKKQGLQGANVGNAIKGRSAISGLGVGLGVAANSSDSRLTRRAGCATSAMVVLNTSAHAGCHGTCACLSRARISNRAKPQAAALPISRASGPHRAAFAALQFPRPGPDSWPARRQ